MHCFQLCVAVDFGWVARETENVLDSSFGGSREAIHQIMQYTQMIVQSSCLCFSDRRADGCDVFQSHSASCSNFLLLHDRSFQVELVNRLSCSFHIVRGTEAIVMVVREDSDSGFGLLGW